MTLDQIDAFLTAAEHGSFASAASALFISSSTLGYRIANLEGELGYPLFIRSRGSRRVELTVEGHKFVPIAREFKGLWARALGEAGEVTRRVVRFASIHSMHSFVFPAVSLAFTDAGYDMTVIATTTHDALASIRAEEIDFALIGDSAPADAGYSGELLGRERFVVLSNAQSPYDEELRAAELDFGREIYTKFNEGIERWHHRLLGGEFKPQVTLRGVLQLYELLDEYPDCWALAPYGYSSFYGRRGLLKVSRLDDEPAPREVHLVSREGIEAGLHSLMLETLRDRLAGTEGFEPA